MEIQSYPQPNPAAEGTQTAHQMEAQRKSLTLGRSNADENVCPLGNIKVWQVNYLMRKNGFHFSKIWIICQLCLSEFGSISNCWRL